MGSIQLLTVKQVVNEVPAFSEQQIRWYIFNAAKYTFEHVIVKIGRRVLLDRDEFYRWLDSHRLGAIPSCANCGQA